MEKRVTANLAAEFYIASLLHRKGHTVTLTLGNTKEIDILVANNNGKKISIDVKGLKNTTNWPLKPKLKRRDHFFILVGYKNKFDDLNSLPDVFVIPSIQIEKVLSKWSGSEQTGIEYNKIKDTLYKDAWDLLFK